MAGPDLVIAGAARSGTSLLAAQLGEHPRIDAGAVKETNFYSRHFDEGHDWYDAYFRPEDDLLRLDASVSYTYPQHPQALRRLAEDDPRLVVYVAREPLGRTVSHYLLYRYYFKREPAATFGEALASDGFYAEVSDYEHWLAELTAIFPADRLLVVPFALTTSQLPDVASAVCARLGLDAPPAAGRDVMSHQNNVVAFRNDLVRTATRSLRHSGLYPKVRRALGPHVMKRIRAVATTVPAMPTRDEALATCSPEQLRSLHDLAARAEAAVARALEAQDARTGLDWRASWAPTEG